MAKGKKENRVHIEDVAKRAGVAISSVSRVLTGHKAVSESMRNKVEKAALDLGYQPDHLAQSLRRGSTKTIGFMIRDIMNPFFSIIAQSCEIELRKSHYSMILINSAGSESTEKSNFGVLKSRRVDGIISSLVSESSFTKNSLNSFTAPIVLLDREISGLTTSSVLCDHTSGVFDATKYLLSQGHKRIAFISGPENIYVTRNRLDGYEKAYESLNLKPPKDLIRLKDFSEKFAKEETHKLFKMSNPPTAILAGGIGSSGGVLHGLKELKIDLNQVKFIALDEWPFFDLLSPGLSSVHRDPETMGKYAAKLMLELINGGKPKSILIPTTFKNRDRASK